MPSHLENATLVAALIALAPRRADACQTRLTTAAYAKGVAAGIQFDVADAAFPDNPYPEKFRRPNFMRGGNDPERAWSLGSLDGQRIRSILLTPTAILLTYPLRQSEYRILPPDIQAVIDAAGNT